MRNNDDKMEIEVRKSIDLFGAMLLDQAKGHAANVKQIRQKLTSRGFDLRGVSDAEVIDRSVKEGLRMHFRAVNNGWVFVVDKDAMDSYRSVAKDRRLTSEDIPFNYFYLIRYDNAKERVDSVSFYAGDMDSAAGETLFVQTQRVVNTMSEEDFEGWEDQPKAKQILNEVKDRPEVLKYTFDSGITDINNLENRNERIWYMGYHDMCNERHFKKSVRAELPKKLAKKRLRKSGTTFVGKFTVIKPVDSDYQGYESQGGTKAAHWVRGHWKRRKTGVYWWKAHIAGSGQLKPKTGYKL
jgi:hypothetical protein